MMDVPASLDAWTYDTVLEVVQRYESEPGGFDFKDVLHPTGQGKRDHTASIRRTACSMANGDGGYILFGILDPAVPVPDRVVGVLCTSSLRKEFGEKLALIHRAVYFDAKAIPLADDTTRCVFIVHIPTSNLRPHVDSSDGKFLIRGEGGSARPMTYFEVRDQMLYTEGRLQKVTLLRLELATFKTVLEMLRDQATWNVRFDTGAFKVLLADICDMLQADSGLLGFLHNIGTGATVLNPLLDRREEVARLSLVPANQAVAQANAWLVQDVQERLAQLFNRCGEAEQRLATLFGPLQTT
jgi:hypothetical protein